MTKLEFFKQILQQLVDIRNRNESIDDALKNILKDDEFCRDFPIYLSGIGSKYECMLIDTLAQLWDNPEQVKDEITYFLYEGPGKITYKGKEYNIKDVESLCIYLLDFYKITG